MFDPVTADFIRAAAPLPGLDPELLVDELTAAYVDIAAARLSLAADDVQHTKVAQLIDRMSRLADAYESEIVLDVQSDRRRSIAFVAASARQVLSQISKIPTHEERPSPLNDRVIAPEISASLLFLIAQRSADAYEASRAIRAAGEQNAIRRALILSLGRFARGQFAQLLEIDLQLEKLDQSDATGFATDLLFKEILRGLQLLAQSGLGQLGIEAIDEALSVFRRVQELAIDSTIADDLAEKVSSTSVFAGPHHLAALLEKTASSFGKGILVQTPSPAGSDQQRWKEWLSSEAGRWPFLWENHRDAIATGYLNQGSSLVMTTPTGSGKTTLAALKIAATLATGKTVLYLAPTHALVGQVESDLNERVVGLAKAQSIEDLGLDETVEALPDIAVATPERCFALLTFAPQLFSNVGLLVFDEFHLLGVNADKEGWAQKQVDRRAIDAMLCLLTFNSINTAADYLLLSAMVSNGDEISDWLGSLIGRPVTPFDYKWKPTRQLRSCVLYDRTELKSQARSIRDKPPNKKPAAMPYGMFSLSSGWNPGAPDKLLLRSFAPTPIALGRGENKIGVYLTANRFEVAASIAKRFADSGLKVIVFCDSIVNCVSVAKKLNLQTEAFASQRDADQDSLRAAAIHELGSEGAIYDAGTCVAAVHHGELLPTERRLVESLFRKRETNVRVLAATSTLAQGLNLPCDVVILASMDRLDESDPEEKRRTSLAPHEILNALGRAGRAGQAATGYSIVVPGSPTGCDLQTKTVDRDDDLKLIFSEGDQCLPLADPLTTLFDIVEVHGVKREDADYLLRRLAISFGEERQGVETFESLARRTFGYHQMRKRGAAEADSWLETRRSSLSKALEGDKAEGPLPWQEELAAKTGASPKFVAKLAGAYQNAPLDAVDAFTWVIWLLDQLDPAENDTGIFLRMESMTRVFGRAITKQPDEISARKIAIEGTRLALQSWFAGETLSKMETLISAFVAAHEGKVKRPTTADLKAKRARRFALRVAPDFGFLAGILGQIAQRLATESDASTPAMVGFLPQLIRHGFATPYHFALSRDAEGSSRTEVCAEFIAVEAELDRLPTDDWSTVQTKLESARLKAIFKAYSPEGVAAFEALTPQPPTNDE